jgi:tetratricopeptide (TPR) repeat protein
VGIVVSPAKRAGGAATVGHADAERLVMLLPDPRIGFEVHVVDASDDLAGQVEDVLREARAGGEIDALLFFVSAPASFDGDELLVHLDDDALETADAIADTVLALTDAKPRAAPLVLLDLRARRGSEKDALVHHVDATSALDAIHVLAAAVPDEVGALSPSPLTEALVAELGTAAEPIDVEELAFRLRRRFAKGTTAFTARALPASFQIVRGVSKPPASERPPDSESGTVRITLTSVERPSVVPHDSTPPVVPIEVPPPSPSKRSSVPAPQAPAPSDVVKEAMDLASEGQDEAALAKLKRALVLVKSDSPEDANRERARIQLRVGELFVRQRRYKEAINGLEKALELDPELEDKPQVLRMLHTLHTNLGDRRAVHLAEERLLQAIPSDAERAQLLSMFGQSWLRDLDDPIRARERLEHALTLAPLDRQVLELLVELADRDRRTNDSLELRKQLAETVTDPAQRSLRFSTLAEEMIDRKREDEALDLFERALDAHPSGLKPLARLSALLGDRQEWAELEGAYRRMIERAGRLADPDLKRRLSHELHKRLAILLSEHLSDTGGALEEIKAAVALQPEEETGLRSLASIAETAGDVEAADGALSLLVALHPRELALHERLFDVLVKRDRVERAYASAVVQSVLGEDLGDRQRAILGAGKDDFGGRPPGVLERRLASTLRWPLVETRARGGLDRTARIFRVSNRALCAGLTALTSRAGRLAPLDEGQRVDAEATTVSAARSLAWAARALDAETPAIYLDDASEEGMVPVLRARPVTVVGARALRGRSLEELTFLAGYNVAGHLPEHRVVRLSSSVYDLASCFIAVVRRAAPDTGAASSLRTFVDLLAPVLDGEMRPEEDVELKEAVLAFAEGGTRVDLAAYGRAVDRACLRAGLLLAADLEAALSALPALPKGALSTEEREEELLAFAVSELAAELRESMSR